MRNISNTEGKHAPNSSQTEWSEIETSNLGAFRYTRYEPTGSANLGATTAKLGVVRTEQGWANPALIKQSLIILHSALGDDREPLSYDLFESLSALQELGTVDHIQLVFPEIARSFLHDSPLQGKPKYGQWLLQEVLPFAETGTTIVPACRTIAGVSMGGFASVSAFLRNPKSFGACLGIMPGVIDWDFRSEEAAKAYCQRNQLPAEVGALLQGLFVAEFGESQDYEAFDPITISEKMDASELKNSGKRISLFIGLNDSLGLLEGTRKLAEILRAKSVETDLVEIKDGGHDMGVVKALLPQILREFTHRPC